MRKDYYIKIFHETFGNLIESHFKKMNFLKILLCTILTNLVSAEIKPTWNIYKSLYNLEFDDQQSEKANQETWTKKLKSIHDHNKAFLENKLTYSVGLNKFSHLSYDEVISKYTGYKPLHNRSETMSSNYKRQINTKSPNSVDWSTTYLVGPIKDQGTCG